jgi:hypothetical protein
MNPRPSRYHALYRLAMLSIIIIVCGCGTRSPQPSSSDAVEDQARAVVAAATTAGSVTTGTKLADDRGSTTSIVPGLDARLVERNVAVELHHVDPQIDAWDTEAFNEAASSQLKQLAKLVHHPDNAAGYREQLESMAASDFTATALRPTSLETAYQDTRFTVRRLHASASPPSPEHHRLADVFDALREAFRQELDLEFRFKIVRVDRLDAAVHTTVFVELSASRAGTDRFVQQASTWQCAWTGDLAKPLLASIALERFEEVESRGQVFTDDTATVLGLNESYDQQLIYGADHWRQTLDWRYGQEIAGPHGLAIADVNGDGLDDVYYCETGGLPNRLFVQLPDGTVEDRSAQSGLDFLEPTHCALFFDSDNDGDQDVILAVGRFVIWLKNDGDGRFVQQGILQTNSMLRSMAAADYDNDGDLDIYACGYFPRDSLAEGVGLGRPMPYHDANNGVPNLLLSNDGTGNFQDVTSQVGLDTNNRRFSYAAAWEDYDNDGDVDLYVANDFGRNNLYRNDNGHFVDVAAEAGVEDVSAGMSVSWSDFDRDGYVDLYVGNMFSSAGNRITYQRRFRDDEPADTRAHYQRHARGNTLFRNRGDGTFEDVSETANVTMGRWSWGSNFVDINNDGWDDLLVGNGMVTSVDDPDDL